VIYDVPLLFEAGIDKRVDKTVVVTADLKTQIERLEKRNGLTRAEALRRIRNQMPLSLKRHRADYVLDGTKQPRRLASDVNQLFKYF
jgi:dephospho-CoA kinase